MPWPKFGDNPFGNEDLLLIPPPVEEQLAADWNTLRGREPELPPDLPGRLSKEDLRTFILKVLGGDIFLSSDIKGHNEFECGDCQARTLSKERCHVCQSSNVVTHWKPNVDPPLIFLPLIFGALDGWTTEQRLKIGMIYAHHSSALPRGINGYPMFTEVGFLHVDDWAIAEKTLRRETSRLQDLDIEDKE